MTELSSQQLDGPVGWAGPAALPEVPGTLIPSDEASTRSSRSFSHQLRQSLEEGALEDDERPNHSSMKDLADPLPPVLRRTETDGDVLRSLPDPGADRPEEI